MHLVVASGVFFASRSDTSRIPGKPGVNALRTFCTLVLEAPILFRRQSWEISISTVANIRVALAKTILEMVSVFAIAIGETQVVCSLCPYAIAIGDGEFINYAQSSNGAGASGLRE